MKRLYLLRHAKAAPDDGGGDHERRLTPRGRGDAPSMAREIARRGFVPDWALCSTSRRTAETLDLVLPHLTPVPQSRLEPGLYHADATQILHRAGLMPDDVHSVLIVGHNPGLEALALALARTGKIARQIADKFPTAAFAAFESDSKSWRAGVRGSWTALDYFVPVDL